MRKNLLKKAVAWVVGGKLQKIITGFSEISQKQEKELKELDRIAKMLVRRNLELTEIREKREAELKELKETRAALMNMLEDFEEARKKAEQERDKTLAIINNFADGLLVFDKENKLSLVNPQAELFFQIKGQDLIGKSISEIGHLPNVMPLVDLLTEKIKSIYRKKLPLRENLILEVSSVSIVSKDEKIGTLIILHDVTRENLVEKLKTEFVSLSAHQLRTPLSAIKWILKMLLDGDLGPLNKEQKEFLEKAFYSNERMINLINDLLNITRIEEGRFLFEFKPADIIEVTEKIIDSFKDEIERKKIKFEFKKPPKKLSPISLDVEKIKLAIENLIDNAITYTPEGGRVYVSLKGNKEILFSVKDSGIGIPEDQKERVFTKFFRAKNALKIETEGSGLGLYITKNIIEAHGGKIWFESKENKGSTFYFTLPYKKI